jgi:hypothetical protein
MNSLSKFIASIAALIASLALAWIALTVTGAIPNRPVQVSVYHDGEVKLVSPGFGGLSLSITSLPPP